MTEDHWHTPLVHVRGKDLSADTAQTSGMARLEAISGQTAGSEKVWMGQTHVAPGTKSGDHHHGEAETAIYILSGTPAFVFGRDGQEVRLQTEPGDYIFVPPYVPHREETPARTKPWSSSPAAPRKASSSTSPASGPTATRNLPNTGANPTTHQPCPANPARPNSLPQREPRRCGNHVVRCTSL